MNLGQAVYLDEGGQVRYHPTYLASVLAFELCRVPLFAYLALRPPAYSQGPFHSVKKERQ